jgi:hypothetical protein
MSIAALVKVLLSFPPSSEKNIEEMRSSERLRLRRRKENEGKGSDI